MVNTWNDKVKIFRYINRCSLSNDDYPVRIDVSIVKIQKIKVKIFINF